MNSNFELNSAVTFVVVFNSPPFFLILRNITVNSKIICSCDTVTIPPKYSCKAPSVMNLFNFVNFDPRVLFWHFTTRLFSSCWLEEVLLELKWHHFKDWILLRVLFFYDILQQFQTRSLLCAVGSTGFTAQGFLLSLLEMGNSSTRLVILIPLFVLFLNFFSSKFKDAASDLSHTFSSLQNI